MTRAAWILGVFACGFLVLASAGTARAGSVYGTNVDLGLFESDGDSSDLTWTGFRTAVDPQQVIATESWAPLFRIDWLITNNEDGTFTYRYTFTGLSGKDLSHFTLDVSDNVTAGDIEFDHTVDTDSPGNDANGTQPPAWDLELVNKDGITSALKFDFGGPEHTYIQVTVDRVPMWGDFYAKSGKQNGNDVEAYNLFLGNHNDTDNVLGYIPTPDTERFPPQQISAPLPTSAWMTIALLGMLGLVRAMRRKRRLAA